MTTLRTQGFSYLNRNLMVRDSAQVAEKSSFFAPQSPESAAQIPYLLNQKVKP